MCDVLDLSVRCQSQQLPSADNWTPSKILLTQVNTSPHWSNTMVSRAGQYELEPVSPSSSPVSQPPSSLLVRREVDDFYPRQHVDITSQQSPATDGRWFSDVSVATTSTTGLMSSSHRRWNGECGHPYSPLKRALHQYRNSAGLEENSVAESNNSSASTSNSSDVESSPPTSSSTTMTENTCRKPTTTTAGMSFEEFVLGMLSKVGGGKAITASTQSYLRETASNSSSSTVDEARTTAFDAAQKQTVPVQHSVHDETTYQIPEQRRQLERQMLATTIHRDEYSPSSYHLESKVARPGPVLQYPPPRPPPDLRLIAALPQPSLPATMRRPPMRAYERDEAYRERRRKNNEAAKRSRDTRRFKELQVAAQAERLAEENLQLKAEIAVLRSQLGYLHRMMLDNNNGSHVNGSGVTDDERQNDNSSHQHQYPPEDGARTT